MWLHFCIDELNCLLHNVFVVKELDEALKDLVNWERFAIHLPGINFADTNVITRDFSRVGRQKLELFDLWLSRYPLASWTDVISALKEIGEDRIAGDIETGL